MKSSVMDSREAHKVARARRPDAPPTLEAWALQGYLVHKKHPPLWLPRSYENHPFFLDVFGISANEVHGRRGSRVDLRSRCRTFRVQGSGFRVQGSGFRVQGSGFRVQGLGPQVTVQGVAPVGARA